MKKFTKKIIVAIVAVAAAVCMSVSLAACGEKTASVKAVYTADPQAGAATYQTVPMKMILTNAETLTVYDNDTYCLSVATTVITGIQSAFEGTGEIINRGLTVVEYYGTCTYEEDSGITTYSLAKPERITVTNNDTLFTAGLAVGHYDTDNWTDAVTEAFAGAKSFFGITAEDGKVDLQTFFNKFAFETKDVSVSSGMFDYVKVSFHNVLMGF